MLWRRALRPRMGPDSWLRRPRRSNSARNDLPRRSGTSRTAPRPVSPFREAHGAVRTRLAVSKPVATPSAGFWKCHRGARRRPGRSWRFREAGETPRTGLDQVERRAAGASERFAIPRVRAAGRGAALKCRDARPGAPDRLCIGLGPPGRVGDDLGNGETRPDGLEATSETARRVRTAAACPARFPDTARAVGAVLDNSP